MNVLLQHCNSFPSKEWGSTDKEEVPEQLTLCKLLYWLCHLFLYNRWVILNLKQMWIWRSDMYWLTSGYWYMGILNSLHTFGSSLSWLASRRSSSKLRLYRNISSGTVCKLQCRLSTDSTWRLQRHRGIHFSMSGRRRGGGVWLPVLLQSPHRRVKLWGERSL